MKLSCLGLLVAVALLIQPTSAWSFKLSPCLRVLTYESGKLSQQGIRRFNRCAELLPEKYRLAVHEHMTLQTLLKYRGKLDFELFDSGWKFQYMVEPAWSKGDGQRHLTYAIIFGTWWNDDPLMRTWGQGKDFASGALATSTMFKDGRKTYPGSENSAVPHEQHLGRLSHFGGLQHLHFMTQLKRLDNGSTAEERVSSTTEEALRWMEFAYRVATGSLAPDAPLTTEMERAVGLPSIALNHGVRNAANVKVRTLFSRLGQSDDYRNMITPDIALGSMLHVLQDSFSPSHARRIDQKVGESTFAVLVDVENYAEQNADAHGLHDFYPVWLNQLVETGQNKYANDPVVVGAWLLDAVDRKLPWECVKAHLRSTIFARQGEPGKEQNSGPLCMAVPS